MVESAHLDPAKPTTAGSTSRGTARSIRSRGARPRCRFASASLSGSRCTMRCGAPVELITTSALVKAWPSPSALITRPPWRWASRVALAGSRPRISTSATPRLTSCLAASSLVVPAPISRAADPLSGPRRWRANSTLACGTLAIPRPMAVCERTRRPAAIADSNRRRSCGPAVPVETEFPARTVPAPFVDLDEVAGGRVGAFNAVET